MPFIPTGTQKTQSNLHTFVIKTFFIVFFLFTFQKRQTFIEHTYPFCVLSALTNLHVRKDK